MDEKRREKYKKYLSNSYNMDSSNAEAVTDTVAEIIEAMKKRSLNLYQIEAIKEILECEIKQQLLFNGQQLKGAND